MNPSDWRPLFKSQADALWGLVQPIPFFGPEVRVDSAAGCLRPQPNTCIFWLTNGHRVEVVHGSDGRLSVRYGLKPEPR